MLHVHALSRCTNILLIESNSFEENLVICQNRDETIKALKIQLESSELTDYEMRNGVVYRKSKEGNLLFYVPEKMEEHVLYRFHDQMGHASLHKMVDLIKKSFWFPKIESKASEHIGNCLSCIAYSSSHGKAEGFLNSIPKSDKPFEIVHIDHYGPVDSGRTYKYILVVIDAFTKFVRLYPAKTTKSTEVIAALKDYFRAYSKPKSIISDRGTCFTSQEFKDFLGTKNVRQILIATGSPQANGQVERVNRSIGPMVAKLVDSEKGIYWDHVLEEVEFVLNNTLHKSTNVHPSNLLFGTGQRGRQNEQLEELLNSINEKTHPNVDCLRKKASESQTRSQNYNKAYVDKRRKPPKIYKEGDYVMIKNFDSSSGVTKK